MIFFIFVLLSFAFRPTPSFASCTDSCTDTETCQQVINECTSQLETLAKSKDTLSNQIKILTSQVELTLLKINQTEVAIKSLIKEIDALTQKINSLDVDLNQLSSVFIELTAKNYKLSKTYTGFYQLLASGFDNFVHQYKYLTVIQKEIRTSLLNLETARTNYDIQKEEKKKKQTELDALQKRLLDQKNSLSNQKATKNRLLEITKNDEAKYANLKREAQLELQSLLRAKQFGKPWVVKKGDIIGYMGNTGYSTGPHLHFGLYNIIEDKRDEWNYYNDTPTTDYLNSHIWPLKNYSITQYPYGPFTHQKVQAYDLISNNLEVYAINDGVAYSYRDPDNSYNHGYGNHIKIFHSDGKMSLYLHLQ